MKSILLSRSMLISNTDKENCKKCRDDLHFRNKCEACALERNIQREMLKIDKTNAMRRHSDEPQIQLWHETFDHCVGLMCYRVARNAPICLHCWQFFSAFFGDDFLV